MLAAKDERHAAGATLLFNVMHYAVRPWPWILVALASLVVYPDVASLQAAFPAVDGRYVRDDLAYPAMLARLPSGLLGLLGLLVTSLVAAYMSTMSTAVNDTIRDGMLVGSNRVNAFHRQPEGRNSGGDHYVTDRRLAIGVVGIPH